MTTTERKPKNHDELLTYIKTLNFFPEKVKTRNRTRSSGEGTIRKSGNSYEGRITIGFDENGKQIRKAVYAKTKKACIEKMQALRIGEAVPIIEKKNNVPTLVNWLNTWFNEYKKNSAVITKQRYLRYIKLISEQPFANSPINELKALELQQYINSQNNYDYAKRQIGLFKEALEYAQANGYVDKNIAVLLKNPFKPTTTKKDEDKSFTHEEENLFINAIKNNPYRTLYYLCLYAGMRRGEVCALTWENIDLSHKVINIVQAASRSEIGGYTVGKTKTVNSVRTVPISDTLYSELIKAKKSNGFVYENNGKILNADMLTMDFTNIMNSLGMNHNLHQLRHTFATRCHEKGIDVKVVQSWMGHSKVDTTFNTYTHATKDMLNAATEQLNNNTV